MEFISFECPALGGVCPEKFIPNSVGDLWSPVLNPFDRCVGQPAPAQALNMLIRFIKVSGLIDLMQSAQALLLNDDM